MRTEYNAIPYKSGYIVEMKVFSNYGDKPVSFYADKDGLWLRSRTPLTPMSQEAAIAAARHNTSDDKARVRRSGLSRPSY